MSRHLPSSPATPAGPLLRAPLWRRVLAGAVDGLVLLPGLAGLGWLWVVTFEIEAPRNGLPWLDWLVQLLRGDDPMVIGGALVLLLAWTVTRSVVVVSTGSTAGLALLGLRLVDDQGRDLSATLGIVRTVTSLLSMLLFSLGYLWVVFDPQGQTLQDKVAGAHVVKSKHSVIV